MFGTTSFLVLIDLSWIITHILRSTESIRLLSMYLGLKVKWAGLGLQERAPHGVKPPTEREFPLLLIFFVSVLIEF